MTLKSRLFGLACSILLVTACFAFISYRGGAQILFSQAGTSDRRMAERAARAVSERIAAWENVLLTASSNIAFMIEDLGVLPGTLGNYMRNLTEASLEQGFLAVSFALSSGVLLEGSGWFPPEEYDPRNETWFKEAEKGRGPVFNSRCRNGTKDEITATADSLENRSRDGADAALSISSALDDLGNKLEILREGAADPDERAAPHARSMEKYRRGSAHALPAA